MRWVNCEGWWEQDYYGRQPMNDLQLSFVDGKISGQGQDIVGKFTFSGELENEKVLLRKHYVGRHFVEYPGVFDGEGTMQGLWNIEGYMGGKWMIRVTRRQAESTLATNAEVGHEDIQEMTF